MDSGLTRPLFHIPRMNLPGSSKISATGETKGMYFPISSLKDEKSGAFCSTFALLMTRGPKKRHLTISAFINKTWGHGTAFGGTPCKEIKFI